MQCREVLLRLWEYLDDELAPEESRKVGEHLSRCHECQPAYCCDRALLELLARQRDVCSAPATLVTAIRVHLSTS